MSPVRRDILIVAILVGFAAVLIWADSMPAWRVPVGVAMIALAISAWIRPIIRPRPAGTADLSQWQKAGLSAALVLFAVSKIWPQHDLSALATFCMFAPQIPQVVRSWR